MKYALQLLAFVALMTNGTNAFAATRPAIADIGRTTITIGGAPDWMITGDGALWIANITLEEVERVDAATNTVVARIPLHGKPCAGIAFGFSSVWVPMCDKHDAGTSLVRIDAASNKVQRVLSIPPANTEGGITTSPRDVWMATAQGVLSRIDPRTNAVSQRVAVAAGSYNPRYAAGTVWITSGTADLLTAVDETSGSVVARIHVAHKPHMIAAGGGSVWTVDQGDGSVTRVDLASKRVVATIAAHIPGSGGDICYGAGFAWATLVATPLTKISASSNTVAGQWYGRGGDGIACGLGSVWLADYNNHIVWRINP